MFFLTKKREKALIEELTSKIEPKVIATKPKVANRNQNRPGKLVKVGSHSHVVKYDSGYVLFKGKKRNTILLKSYKLPRINAAMRAVERFAGGD